MSAPSSPFRSTTEPPAPASARPRAPVADSKEQGAPVSDVTSFFHEDNHPWLLKTVRDIATRGEGTLTAIVQEDRGVRVAHIRPASGVEWTTAAGNIRLLS